MAASNIAEHHRLLVSAIRPPYLDGVETTELGLTFTYSGLHGRRHYMTKLDTPSGDVKYLFAGNEGQQFAVLKYTGTETALLLVEGTRQARAAASYAPDDVAVVGMNGCYGFMQREDDEHSGVNPELAELVRDRDAVLAFDADRRTNPNVYDAAAKLGAECLELGASSVRFLNIRGEGSDGVDDLLDALPEGDREAWLRSRLESATEDLGERPPAELTRWAPVLPDAFWDARPTLAHIRAKAWARGVAPDAFLGATLAHVAAAVPPRVQLPPLVGSPAPLNVCLTIVAGSGLGKGTATGVSAEVIRLPAKVRKVVPGSGEGMTHAYWEQVPGEDGKKEWARFYDGVLFDVDEGEAFLKQRERSGQTAFETVRSGWSGKALGSHYASVDKRRPVEAGTYRFVLLMGIQDRACGVLLGDDAGGTPQRFVWFSGHDPVALDHLDDRDPGPLDWTMPDVPAYGTLDTRILTGRDDVILIDVADEIRHEIREHQAKKRAQLVVDGPYDSHRGLSKLKVAALLAILDGRLDVTVEDWGLAELVMETSDAVRTRAFNAVQADENAREAATSRRYAGRKVEADAAVDRRRRAAQCALDIAEKVAEEPGKWTRGKLRAWRKGWRDVFDDGLDRAFSDGLVAERAEAGQGDQKLRLWPVEGLVEGLVA